MVEDGDSKNLPFYVSNHRFVILYVSLYNILYPLSFTFTCREQKLQNLFQKVLNR